MAAAGQAIVVRSSRTGEGRVVVDEPVAGRGAAEVRARYEEAIA